MEKRIFLILSIALILGFFGWYLFVDLNQQNQLNKVETQLKEISLKVRKARLAQMNMSTIEQKFKKEKKRLEHVKMRFISRNDLSLVADTLNAFAKKHSLKLMDFSPAFEQYFSEDKQKKISTLPIDISVQGRYLKIGKFIENWPGLPFYIVAEEVTLERVEQQSNLLSAKIKALLYTWNE